MKKNLLMVLGMVMLMMLSVASADSGNAATLPDGIKQILNGSAWSSYEIGRVNYGSQLTEDGYDACGWYDEHGFSAAFVLMHSEKKNVLCIFEKNASGKWVLKKQSSGVVKQGEWIPTVYTEAYGIYYLYYNDKSSYNPVFDITVTKKNNDWYVTEIGWEKDGVSMGIYPYENKIEYLKIVYTDGGSKSTRTTVEGVTPPTSFAEFSLDNIPMTPEKARAQLSLPPDIPQSAANTACPSRRTSSSRQTRNTPSILDPAKTTSAAAMARRRYPQTTGFRCSAGKMAGLCFSTILPAITCASAGFRKAHCRRTRMSAICSLVKRRCGRRFQAT